MSVSDDFQGHGLGSILIGHLAQAAREVGITTFAADVLPENHRMIGVFRDSGFSPTIRSKPGVVEVDVPDGDHRRDDGAVRRHGSASRPPQPSTRSCNRRRSR